MTSSIRRRLQVFVSSTYTDLKTERQAAVEAILTAGHIPAGMELFTSGDKSQMEVIKQWIDESDVFLLILGGRYGSLDSETGKSYTHLEYEYAIESGKPSFACVIKEGAIESRVQAHGSGFIETDNAKELKKFREFVLTKVVKFWDDYKDIKIIVGETLSSYARRDDLKGWVRADDQANAPALANEIARLSSENAALRSRLDAQEIGEEFNGLSFSKLVEVLSKTSSLQALYANRKNLSEWKYFQEDNIPDIDVGEMQLRGLAYKDYAPGVGKIYRLTDAGKKFLNKLDVKGLPES
jgi:hypothetical protein